MLTIDYTLLRITDGERVLDVGCGEGRHSWEAVKRARCLVFGLDIETGGFEKASWMFHAIDHQGEARGRLFLIRGDTIKLPFKDAAFDKIICSEVLEHILDDRAGMRELVRVLKNEGTIAISVPAYLTEAICWKLSRDYHDRPGGHVRIYKKRELIAPILENNLHIYAIRRKHALHSIYWIIRCLFGVNRDNALIPTLYHKFLVWDIEKKSKSFHLLDNLLNRFFPKSVVIYACKRGT